MLSVGSDSAKTGGQKYHGALSSSTYDNLRDVTGVSIAIASPQDILDWSWGEVKKAETINYRTGKPESSGLFSASIFGPPRDFECLCGKYSRMKYRGIVCEKCGVEVTTSKVRRERMGHIELVAPVVHTYFLRKTNSPISIFLGSTVKDIEKVLYFESVIVTDAGNTTLSPGQIMSNNAYKNCLNQFGDSFTVGAGAEVIRDVLTSIDIDREIERMSSLILNTNSESKKRLLSKRLKLLKGFKESGNRPEWMVLNRIPVMPPDLRPLVQLDGGRFVSSDLNELYKRVINRNARLKLMMDAKAPPIIIKNEKRMLQESVDALFDNSKKLVSAKTGTNRPLKSLSEYLKGKQGRFRLNLLGKRVDYSGRSVITVGPSLSLHECGLPKMMALELFKPFVFFKLTMYGYASSVRTAKRLVEQQSPEVWGVLEEVIKDHLVLLNRAPTLHRLNIQAFQPRLIESKAIQLHPLVCKAFNADFDGDQMAVHVPLSIEAQTEAWVLMLSSNNVLSPQNGQPVITPSKDILVGLYYMTVLMKDDVLNGRLFDSYNDILFALQCGVVNINTTITYRYSYSDHADPVEAKKVHTAETIVGRVIIYNFFKKDGKIPFERFNVNFNSKNIGDLLHEVYVVYGRSVAVDFADRIKELGFEYSTKAGISFGKDDMVVPETKAKHIAETFAKITVAEKQYADGYITYREKYNQVTDRWSECADSIGRDVMTLLATSKDTSTVNSLYIMMLAGARVSEPVIRQISAMRGLMAKPSGEIIETPIISNFKEGMTVLEYFNSAHGARKGAADTALKTSDAGYLTRRLVDVAQDCIITEEDCGTADGISYYAGTSIGGVSLPLSKLVFGRVLSESLVTTDGEIILYAGTLIDRDNVSLIDRADVLSAKVRSPVQCATVNGICSVCYGKDLSTGKLANVGEAVGIIAAQSIGEPGAQLTMRTFHIGGATSRSVEKSSLSAGRNGIVKFENLEYVTSSAGVDIVVSYSAFICICSSNGDVILRHPVQYGANVLVKNGSEVSSEEILAKWDPYNRYIISEYDGYVKNEDLVAGVSFTESSDEDFGRNQKVITDWSGINRSLNPRIVICDKMGNPVSGRSGVGIARYMLPVDAIVGIQTGERIQKGDVIARIPRESMQVSRDITGGLPRVEDIFEARSPKEPAIIAETDGIVEFMNDYKTRNHLAIRPIDGSEKVVTYNIQRGKHIYVNEGSFVRKGDIIVDGSLDPHDILSVSGVEALVRYMTDEVQQVYRLQGAEIDNKHIEIIIRCMLQKVEVLDRGDLVILNTQQIDLCDIEQMNAVAISEGKRPATYRRMLQGITRAALKARSFISAAAFQETMKVLVESAVCGREDPLIGMKENVIVGRLVPAGTGFVESRLRNAARRIAIDNEKKKEPSKIDLDTSVFSDDF